MERGYLRGTRRRAPAEETMPKRLAVATSTVSNTGVTTATDLTGLSIGFTVTSRFPVRVTLYCPFVFGSASGAVPATTICDQANTELELAEFSCAGSNFVNGLTTIYEITAPGVYSLKARLKNGTGTGTVSNNADAATVVSRLEANEFRTA